MKLVNKTIVITGGTSGIGFQMVKQLSRHNLVIVIARQSHRLGELKQAFPNIEIYPADLSKTDSYADVAQKIRASHQRIDLLINNAAVQHTPTFLDNDFDYEGIQAEINLNFTAVCSLCYLLLPAMLNHSNANQTSNQNSNPAVVANINSGLGLTPKSQSAVYCATKAAMDNFSQSLRYQLETTNVRIMQAFLPLVDTPMTHGRGSGKMTAAHAAADIIDGIEQGVAIKDIGKVKLLRLLLRLAPSIARKLMKRY